MVIPFPEDRVDRRPKVLTEMRLFKFEKRNRTISTPRKGNNVLGLALCFLAGWALSCG